MFKRLHVWLFYLAFVVATPSPILWYHSFAQKTRPYTQASMLSLPMPAPRVQLQRRALTRRQLANQERETLAAVGDQTQQTIAVVGEIYRPIRQKYGDIPSIQKPLQKAKRALARGDYDKARQAVRQSWKALKAHSPTVNEPTLPWLITAKK